jgi:hypothetical protein
MLHYEGWLRDETEQMKRKFNVPPLSCAAKSRILLCTLDARALQLLTGTSSEAGRRFDIDAALKQCAKLQPALAACKIEDTQSSATVINALEFITLTCVIAQKHAFPFTNRKLSSTNFNK